MVRLVLAGIVFVSVPACGKPLSGDSALSAHRIAEVVTDHLERTPVKVDRWEVMTRELGVEAPGAQLRFAHDDFLAVAVAPTTDSALVCARPTFFDQCVSLVHDGTKLILGWQEFEPEEDPGVVYVINRRDSEDVVADYSGTLIKGDPRKQRLGISIEEMADIVTDDRLTLR